MEIRYRINPKLLIFALLGAIMMCSSYLMFVYEPLHLIIKKVLTLSPGSIFFYLWSSPPYNVYINIYIFNVTNSQDVINNQAKLKVQEVGPYCYQEILTNENATFNQNGTVTFFPRRKLVFVRSGSIGDPDVDKIISPNIPLIGILSAMKESSVFNQIAVSTVSNVVNAQPFLTLTITEYLWGYDDRLVTLANKALPHWIDFPKFGILDRIMSLENANNTVTITTDPIVKPPNNPLMSEEELGQPYYIQQYNGSPGLKNWGYTEKNGTAYGNSKCNTVQGAFEGTLFPPAMAKTDILRLYRKAFCRPLSFTYEKEVTSNQGFKADQYSTHPHFLGTAEEFPDNACYCKNKECPPSGIANLSPCYYDMPVTISQPHFYNSARFLVDQVDGMKPNKSLHGSKLVIHHELGLPLEASLRLQINMDVGETKFNARTKYFNNLYLPLFWLEMSVTDVPDLVYYVAIIFYSVLPIVFEICKYIFLILGAALVSGSALWVLQSARSEEDGSPFPITNFSLRRSSQYRPIPVITIPQQYLRPGQNRICK